MRYWQKFGVQYNEYISAVMWERCKVKFPEQNLLRYYYGRDSAFLNAAIITSKKKRREICILFLIIPMANKGHP